MGGEVMNERPVIVESGHVETWHPRGVARLVEARHLVIEGVLLVGAVTVGIAALALLALVILNALLAGLVLAVVLVALAFRQGGLIALAGAAWHAVDRWRP